MNSITTGLSGLHINSINPHTSLRINIQYKDYTPFCIIYEGLSIVSELHREVILKLTEIGEMINPPSEKDIHTYITSDLNQYGPQKACKLYPSCILRNLSELTIIIV